MANNSEPSLDDLSLFLAVCRSGGFRAAAKLLGLSPSHVSETIARIEAQLGVPLFSRTTRSVMPTEAGKKLADRIAPLLAQTRAALYDATSAHQEVRGRLKLNVTGAVMVDILPPLIDRLLTKHPGVRVEVMVDDRLVDITLADCDAGIRYREHLAQDMIAVPIGPPFQHLAVAAAPSYLRSRGIPRHPWDLLKHDCVRLRFSSGALTQWTFEREGERLNIDPSSRLIVGVDAAAAAIDLACRGHGLICAFGNWLDPYIQSGQLEPVLSEWWHRFEGPLLYFPSRLMPAPLRAFIDLVSEDRTRS
ncbi:LysR family transcriptional regulator [Pararobbsia silviterrae]|uniref:LysR family transcriptional regulator n=1 Tax=Pararobbsia silviterrae TaxID=1792498 RepID=A0A494XXL9_9BURK|nr:LysR family transcriptional regulator [Pararobbsia silviterrae]RKP53768.1 LysR family transcriptional regulator [Pararobbsia silviterrae]